MRTLKMAGNSTVHMVDAPDPVAGPGEVVVRTAASALCGSELHGYRGAGREGKNSGHEAAGTVVQVGEGVESLRVGDRVGVSGVVGCGKCAYCLAGRQTYCQARLHYGSTHATMILAAAHGCYRLPPDVPWDAGVLLTGDGMGVPYHTSTRLADPRIQTVAIFGAGPIGLGNVIMQTFLGRRVIAVDLSPERREIARRLGAAETIDPREVDPVAQIRALTGGAGADACLEAAGRPETLKQCFAAVRTAGVVAMNGEQPKVELSPSEDFIRRDVTAFGSWFYHMREVPRMIGLYRQGLPVADLITHRYPLEEAAEAFREFAAGRTGKVLLVAEE